MRASYCMAAFAGVLAVAVMAREVALADDTHQATWVTHRVLPGERVSEIAARYAADEEQIRLDNQLQEQGLRAGARLRVQARVVPKQIEYTVRFGDNWTSIAERHGITRSELRRWNEDVPRSFAAGTVLRIWVESDFVPTPPTGGLGVDRTRDGLRLVEIEDGSQSVGRPDRGRLLHGVQLPENPALYWVRRPEFAYGSTHALTHLQLALARFRRDSDYRLPLVVSDISERRGGAYATHDSHQSGRDVDLWLPLRAEALVGSDFAHALEPALGPPPDLDYALLNADRPADIDWDAAWQLVKALIRTGEVQYIFLSRGRQRALYRAAREEGLSVQALGEIIQYPRRSQTAIVRHAPDHTRHLHIRFRCATGEPRCR